MIEMASGMEELSVYCGNKMLVEYLSVDNSPCISRKQPIISVIAFLFVSLSH